MKVPKYIQRKRTKGFKLPPNTLCCTRPGKWGNPWVIGDYNKWTNTTITPEISKAWYEDDLTWKFAKQEFLDLLKYDYLACWCPEDAEYCHVQHSLIPRLKQIYENQTHPAP